MKTPTTIYELSNEFINNSRKMAELIDKHSPSWEGKNALCRVLIDIKDDYERLMRVLIDAVNDHTNTMKKYNEDLQRQIDEYDDEDDITEGDEWKHTVVKEEEPKVVKEFKPPFEFEYTDELLDK